jgi:intracellular sulfur oxidation DsrE/DsrF family protein
MKKLILFSFLAVLMSTSVRSQTKALDQNREFTGAKANLKDYHAIYQLDSNDPKIINKALRNISNALEDPRLKGKIHLELIAFSGGTDAYLKGSAYEDQLKELVEKGVIVSQCNNTLKERKISRDQLYDFIAVVPSGNGELIIRQAQGWSVIKP